MSHRYTHFLIDVPIEGDPDPIAQADDAHLLDHAKDTLVETVGETPAGWFAPDSVDDGAATFRLRVGMSHADEPTDTEAIYAALRVLREYTVDAPPSAGALQYDCVAPTGPLGESDGHDSNSSNTDGIDTDTDSGTTEPGGSTTVDDAGDDDRQGLLASAMRGN